MAQLAGGPINTQETVRSIPQGQPVPPGVYSGVVVKTQQKNTSDQTGVFVEVEFDLTAPPEFANRKFWDRFNVLNKNADASRIGKEGLADLGAAAGFPMLSDDEELLGREVLLELYIEPAKPYVKNGVEYAGSPQNKCRKYWPIGTDVDAARKTAKANASAKATTAAPAGTVAGAPSGNRWSKPAAAPQATAAPTTQTATPTQAPATAAAPQPASAPATNVAPWKRNKQ